MPPRKLATTGRQDDLPAAWTPRLLAELNGQHVKLVRTAGSFVWHKHDHADEAFLVVEGRLDLHFEDGTVSLGPGELCVVPRGLPHCPEGHAVVLLFEPAGTRNTGEVDHALTVEEQALERL